MGSIEPNEGHIGKVGSIMLNDCGAYCARSALPRDFVAGRTASYNPTLKFHKSRLYAIDGKPQKAPRLNEPRKSTSGSLPLFAPNKMN